VKENQKIFCYQGNNW